MAGDGPGDDGKGGGRILRGQMVVPAADADEEELRAYLTTMADGGEGAQRERLMA